MVSKCQLKNEEYKQDHLTNRSVFLTSLRSMICLEETHNHKLIIFYSYANWDFRDQCFFRNSKDKTTLNEHDTDRRAETHVCEES